MLSGGAQELNAGSRRIFVYLVFGAAVLLVLGNLSTILFMVLRDALEGARDVSVIQDTKWSLSMVLMAGAVSAYYWLDPEAGTPDLSDDELDDTRDRISGVRGDRVLLTLDASGVAIDAFRE